MNLQDAQAAVAIQRAANLQLWFRLTLVLIGAVALTALAFRDRVAYLFASPEQAAEWRATDAMLTHIQMFHVACPDSNLSADDMQRWTAYAQQKGWTPYPRAGAGCVDP